MARKNPETVVVSGFSEPISFSVRIVGCGGRIRFCLCDGHLQKPVLRISPVAVPYIFGGGHSRLENIDRGHALGSLHLHLAALPSLPSGNPEVYLRLATQAEKKKRPPDWVVFLFLVAEAGLEPTTSGL